MFISNPVMMVDFVLPNGTSAAHLDSSSTFRQAMENANCQYSIVIVMLLYHVVHNENKPCNELNVGELLCGRYPALPVPYKPFEKSVNAVRLCGDGPARVLVVVKVNKRFQTVDNRTHSIHSFCIFSCSNLPDIPMIFQAYTYTKSE